MDYRWKSILKALLLLIALLAVPVFAQSNFEATKAKSVNMFAIKIIVFILSLFSDQDVVFAWYYESVKMVCQSVEYYNC